MIVSDPAGRVGASKRNPQSTCKSAIVPEVAAAVKTISNGEVDVSIVYTKVSPLFKAAYGVPATLVVKLTAFAEQS